MFLSACGREVPVLEGMDMDKWKSDRNACLGYRKEAAPILKSEMIKLKGLPESDILTLLGRPDQNELYKRNQKFYSYFLSPGPNCHTPDSSAEKLIIRFNAVGYAQQVSIGED